MIRAALLCLALATPAAAQDRGEWELILTIMEPGVEPTSYFYGIMVSERACHFAGHAMSHVILQAAPMAMVGVTCRLRVSA